MLGPKDNLQMTNFCSIPLEESPCQKRKIIHSNIYRILPKVNQVIYTLDTICMPNIMTLAQAVLQIFCSQCCLSTQNNMSEKGDNSVKYLQNTLDTICMQNIMTLAQAVLQILCSQGPLWVKCLSLKRAIIQSNFDRIL